MMTPSGPSSQNDVTAGHVECQRPLQGFGHPLGLIPGVADRMQARSTLTRALLVTCVGVALAACSNAGSPRGRAPAHPSAGTAPTTSSTVTTTTTTSRPPTTTTTAPPTTAPPAGIEVGPG